MPTSIQGMLTETSKTVDALRAYQSELPLAEEQLAVYEPLAELMRTVRVMVDSTCTDWRMAAQERTAGPQAAARELYKQVRLELEAVYGQGSIRLDEFLHTSSNVSDSAGEWLGDMEKLAGALAANQDELTFAAERLPEVEAAAADLRAAMHEVNMKRAAKELAQAEWEAAKTEYRAARRTLRSKLAAHFGARNHPRLKDFFD